MAPRALRRREHRRFPVREPARSARRGGAGGHRRRAAGSAHCSRVTPASSSPTPPCRSGRPRAASCRVLFVASGMASAGAVLELFPDSGCLAEGDALVRQPRQDRSRSGRWWRWSGPRREHARVTEPLRTGATGLLWRGGLALTAAGLVLSGPGQQVARPRAARGGAHPGRCARHATRRLPGREAVGARPTGDLRGSARRDGRRRAAPRRRTRSPPSSSCRCCGARALSAALPGPGGRDEHIVRSRDGRLPSRSCPIRRVVVAACLWALAGCAGSLDNPDRFGDGGSNARPASSARASASRRRPRSSSRSASRAVTPQRWSRAAWISSPPTPALAWWT